MLTDYNAKIKDIEDKIPSNNNLDTTAALTAYENKIPNARLRSRLWYKNIRHWEIIFTTSDYNKLTNDILEIKIKN